MPALSLSASEDPLVEQTSDEPDCHGEKPIVVVDRPIIQECINGTYRKVPNYVVSATSVYSLVRVTEATQ